MDSLIAVSLAAYGILNIPWLQGKESEDYTNHLLGKLMTCFVCKSFWTCLILTAFLEEPTVLGFLASWGITVALWRVLNRNLSLF